MKQDETIKYILGKLWLLLSFASFSYAVDVDFSGFGTIGGTISDKDYTYLRFIDNDGTLKSSSLIGAQADIKFTDQWKATIQGKVAPAKDSDQDWDATLPWAFLSYRPTNDWLIRAGKMRVPLYLNSQNMDVGVTYEMARLPQEVYSLSPNDDGIGVIVTKSFEFSSGELLIDAFYGKINTPYRTYLREDLSAYSAYGGLPKGANFTNIGITTAGISLTYETDENNRFRAGFYKSNIDYKNKGGGGTFSLQAPNPILLAVFNPIPLPNYYQPDGAMDKNEILVFTLGVDYDLGDGYRIMSEYAMRKMPNADTGPDAQSAYVALSKHIGKWTPYVSLSGITTSDHVKNLYTTLETDPINNYIPVNRQYADYVVASEQKSVALGFSYAISPTQKIKAEWTQSRIGSVSNFLIDSPTSAPITHETINVFSLSYSMTF